MDRSFERIELHHLRRLARIAIKDLTDLFDRKPALGDLYRDRLMVICLCQGGARHFVHQDRGVKDFDVWAFFVRHSSRCFPYRRQQTRDFGPSRFGRHPNDEHRRGRGVDLFGRSIPCENGREPYDCVREWICGKADSPREIRKNPVVVVWPEEDLGSVIWPQNQKKTSEVVRGLTDGAARSTWKKGTGPGFLDKWTA